MSPVVGCDTSRAAWVLVIDRWTLRPVAESFGMDVTNEPATPIRECCATLAARPPTSSYQPSDEGATSRDAHESAPVFGTIPCEISYRIGTRIERQCV